MITVNFKDGDTFAKVYGLKQWDFGQKVYITGLNVQGETIEVHVANVGSDVALRVLGAVHDGNITADIPDVLLQVGSDLKIYIYESTEVEGKTIATAYVQVGKREKPEDYDPPEAQNILQEILAIAKTTKEIAQSVRDDADNGAFDGAPGEDGYSPSVLLAEVEDGVQITVRNKEGDTTALVKNGKDGLPGESAYQTAVKLGFKGTEQEWIESLKYDHSEEFANLAEEVRNTANGIVADRQQIQKNAVDIESLGNNKADAIVSTASGEQITLMDSDNELFKGLHVYGKSTQQTTTGAQLFDVDAGSAGWINGDTGEYYDNNANYVSGFIPVETGVNFSTNVVLSPYLYSYDKDKNFISKEGYGNAFTPQGNIAFIRFCISAESEVARKRAETIMINKGRAVPYEPYTGGKPSPSIEYPQEIMSVGDKGNVNIQVKGNVESVQNLLLHTPNGLPGIPVSTGGNYTDANGQQWICDEKDHVRGKYVQRTKRGLINKVTSFNGVPKNGLVEFLERTENSYKGDAIGILCNKLMGTHESKERIVQGYGLFYVRLSTSRFKNGDNLTIEEANEFFKENPLDVIYILEAPIERDLTPEEITAYKALHTNYPVTTILNDENAGMEVSYVADTKNYIDKKFAELNQAIVNTQISLL